MQPDLTLENFQKFFQQELYRRVLIKTLLNALTTTLLALLLGYPVAYVIARGHPLVSRVLLIAVISPLLVGIVIRSYGWMVLLNRQGLVNQALQALGIIASPLRLTGNDVGVIISLLHVFYPFMVLPLAGFCHWPVCCRRSSVHLKKQRWCWVPIASRYSTASFCRSVSQG